MTTTDAVVFGEAMAMFVPVHEVDLEQADIYRRYVAGAEFNVAVGLSRLGYHIGWMSKVGDDPLGRYLVAEARRQGIATDRVGVDPDNPTGFQLKSQGDEPQVVYFRRGSAASQMCFGSADDGYIRTARLLHVTGIPPALSRAAREFTFAAVATARDAGVRVTFDPNLRPGLWTSAADMRAVLNDLAGGAQWVLPGLAEGEFLTGSRHPEAIADFYLDRGAEAVAVKLGVEGSCVITAEGRSDLPAYPVQLVDSVGAGDGFAVGVISGLLDGAPLQECLARGNAVGALAVTQRGDNEGLPTRAHLEEFMRGHRPDTQAPRKEGVGTGGRAAPAGEHARGQRK